MSNIINITIWTPPTDTVITDGVPMGPRIIHTPERESMGVINIAEVTHAQKASHLYVSPDGEQRSREYWKVFFKSGTAINVIDFDKSVQIYEASRRQDW